MKKINKIALLLTAGALSFSGVNGAFITKSARFIRQPVHATRKMAPSMQGVKRVLGVPVAQVAKIASELQRLSAGASQLEKDTTVFMANLAAHVKNNFAQFKKAKFMQLPKAQQLHVLQRFQGRLQKLKLESLLMQGIKTQFHNLLSKHPYAARSFRSKNKKHL